MSLLQKVKESAIAKLSPLAEEDEDNLARDWIDQDDITRREAIAASIREATTLEDVFDILFLQDWDPDRVLVVLMHCYSPGTKWYWGRNDPSRARPASRKAIKNF